MRNTPALRTVKHYHDHPGYIAALAQNIRDYWAENGRPDKLVMSFHGVPRSTLDKGDPYHCECQKTGRLLAEALELHADAYQVCFQSRFGRAEWLRPYTATTLEQLGKQNTRRVDVVCPGFVSDCLETLEEIAKTEMPVPEALEEGILNVSINSFSFKNGDLFWISSDRVDNISAFLPLLD